MRVWSNEVVSGKAGVVSQKCTWLRVVVWESCL